MCYSDWFIQVNLPLHHHRCYVKRKTFVFWSKLLWRSLTYQLLLNKCQPCQHSQITWQIKEVLPYSCHKRDALWPVHSRDEMDLTGHILQWKWAGERQLFWLSAAPTPVRISDQTGGVRNTNDRAQRWCGIFPSSPCGSWAQMQRSSWVCRCSVYRARCLLEWQKEVSQLPPITNEVQGGGRVEGRKATFAIWIFCWIFTS